MGYNFPDAPYVGQSFAPPDGPIWQWDGLAWKARKEAPSSGVFASGHGLGGIGKAGEGPLGISEATIGDTLPELGDWNGQLWWESDTGKLFIWFDDGSSSQWVQIIAPIIINEASGAVVTATGGTTPRTLADWFAGMGRAEDPPELGFWSDMGPANILKLRDRFFIGAGCVYDGRLNHTTGSWLGEPEDTPGDGNANQHWLERSSQFYVGSTRGGVAILGSTRNSDKNGDPNHTGIAVAGYAYADVGVLGVDDSRGGYFEGVRGFNATCLSMGLEIGSKNLGDNIVGNAYDLATAGATYGLRLVAGGDPALAPMAVNNSTAALTIEKKAFCWNEGIVFGPDSVGEIDVSGKAIAVELPRKYALRWRHAQAANATSGEIRSDNDDLAAEVRIIFENTGLMLRCMDTTQTVELPIAQFPFNGGASIYPSIESGASEIVIRALGLSLDAHVNLVPKGIGNVVTPGSVVACNTMNIPAGGSSGKGFMFSAVPDFGMFFGSDSPTIPAAQGSLYLRSDGDANGRAYISMGDGWVPLVDDVSGKVDVGHIGSGGDAHAVVVADGAAGFMSGADKTRLDDMVPVVAGGVPGLMSGEDKTRLDGIVDVTPDGPSGLMLGIDKTKLDSILPVIPNGIPGLILGADKTKLDSLSALAPVTPGGAPGLMTGSDKIRLDGFTDVVSGGASGFMTGADKARLDGFTDVTPDGVSGFMTGSDKTKLDNIADVVSGGISGLMTGADKTRLDSFTDVIANGPSGFMLGVDKAKLDSIIPVFPEGVPGLMTGEDKTKLDGMPEVLEDVTPGGPSGLMSGGDKSKLDEIIPVVPEGIPGLMTGDDKTKLDAMTAGTGTFIDRVYKDAGTQSWAKPPGLVGLEVWVQAGGGGGGGATSIVGESAHGSGGGGGGYGSQFYDAAAIAAMGSSITVTVGIGGTGGAASNGVGGVGGTSSFGGLSCTGGLGGLVLGSGTSVAMIAGGHGGTTITGAQIPIHGATGQFAVRIGSPASAGGGGGGVAGGGCGGAVPSSVAGTTGVAGVSGAGGSGAFSNNGTGGAAGGAGGVGYIKVREYY